ncbi:hypothetical protein BC831DRAFT_458945 [Entophlyctis helioformis]|nr:hypothetical protein BC831DRAFT_458945 [Entophlyctis helioformis]
MAAAATTSDQPPFEMRSLAALNRCPHTLKMQRVLRGAQTAAASSASAHPLAHTPCSRPLLLAGPHTAPATRPLAHSALSKTSLLTSSSLAARKMPRIILVMGGPGSGKGTVCRRLQEEFNLVHISTGQLLRDAAAGRSPIAQPSAAAPAAAGPLANHPSAVPSSHAPPASLSFAPSSVATWASTAKHEARSDSGPLSTASASAPAPAPSRRAGVDAFNITETQRKHLIGLMAQGLLVPDDFVMDILSAYVSHIPLDVPAVLLDGYPRTLPQAKAFAHKIGAPHMVLVLKAPDALLTRRLLKRGRCDDTDDSIIERLRQYRRDTPSILGYLQRIGSGATSSQLEADQAQADALAAPQASAASKPSISGSLVAFWTALTSAYKAEDAAVAPPPHILLHRLRNRRNFVRVQATHSVDHVYGLVRPHVAAALGRPVHRRPSTAALDQSVMASQYDRLPVRHSQPPKHRHLQWVQPAHTHKHLPTQPHGHQSHNHHHRVYPSHRAHHNHNHKQHSFLHRYLPHRHTSAAISAFASPLSVQ